MRIATHQLGAPWQHLRPQHSPFAFLSVTPWCASNRAMRTARNLIMVDVDSIKPDKPDDPAVAVLRVVLDHHLL